MAATESVAPAAPAAPPFARRIWTPDEVRALTKDDRPSPRYELVDGVLLVTPSPFAPHQRMVLELAILLKPYVDAHGIGETFISPADIALDATSLLQPDVFVVPPESRPKVRWDSVRSLSLAIEIPSKGSYRTDRGRKRLFYQRHRVAEYWVVDLDARVVERWRPDDERPEVLIEHLLWAPRAEVAPLGVDLVALFDRVLGADPDAEADPEAAP